jgi:hypothetical protein
MLGAAKKNPWGRLAQSSSLMANVSSAVSKFKVAKKPGARPTRSKSGRLKVARKGQRGEDERTPKSEPKHQLNLELQYPLLHQRQDPLRHQCRGSAVAKDGPRIGANPLVGMSV